MVHHIVLYRLKQTPTPEILDELMLKTRTMLLRIPEVLSIRCGRNAEGNGAEYPFFVAIDFDSLSKLEVYREHPVYVKYMEDVIKPLTAGQMMMNFEMEPRTIVKQ